jgi:hypothetical protein
VVIRVPDPEVLGPCIWKSFPRVRAFEASAQKQLNGEQEKGHEPGSCRLVGWIDFPADQTTVHPNGPIVCQRLLMANYYVYSVMFSPKEIFEGHKINYSIFSL